MGNKVRDLTGVKIGSLTGIICHVDAQGVRRWWFSCDCGRGEIVKLTIKQVNERENGKKSFKCMCDICKWEGLKYRSMSKRKYHIEGGA